VTGVSGGRLRFRMAYSDRFYDAAQRMLWADERARRAREEGDPARWLGAAARYAWWRGVLTLP
jgi:hypothetical protein